MALLRATLRYCILYLEFFICVHVCVCIIIKTYEDPKLKMPRAGIEPATFRSSL